MEQKSRLTRTMTVDDYKVFDIWAQCVQAAYRKSTVAHTMPSREELLKQFIATKA